MGKDFDSMTATAPASPTRPRTKKARSAKSKRAAARPSSEDVADDRHKVRHDYHDHARVPYPTDGGVGALRKSDAEKRRGGPRGGVSIPFPTKLHVMLSTAEDEGLGHIVSWQPHGRCFLVHKPKEFVSTVMPAYFNQSKLTSFQRQLNLYGFVRITSGRDRGGYYHERFLRHRLFLCQPMARIRIKGTGIKGKASPETEPDFYAMPPIDADIEAIEMNRLLEDEVAAAMKYDFKRTFDVTTKKPSGERQSKRSKKKKEEATSKKSKKKTLDDARAYSPKFSSQVAAPPVAVVSPEAGCTRKQPFFDAFPELERRLSLSSSRPGGLHHLVDLCPPLLSSDSEEATAGEPHSGDDIMFEGQHFHYIDSFALRAATGHGIALSPRKRPAASRQIDVGLSEPFRPLLGSLSESAQSIAQELRDPILTPSTSSSSLSQFQQEEALEINPDTIFSEKDHDDGGWEIGGQSIDLDAELASLSG